MELLVRAAAAAAASSSPHPSLQLPRGACVVRGRCRPRPRHPGFPSLRAAAAAAAVAVEPVRVRFVGCTERFCLALICAPASGLVALPTTCLRLCRAGTGSNSVPPRSISDLARLSSVLLPMETFPAMIQGFLAETKDQHNRVSETEVFACPVCYEPLIRKGPPGINLPAIYRSGFKCSKCNKSFTSKDIFLDLTVTSGTKEYTEQKPARTELFRSPLVSFLYERGWRQNFNRSGFPGLDEEFQMAQDCFQPVAGGILLDVSCGSGLFTRKFAKSGTYSAVIALDFSENMLRQCYEFIKQDGTLLNANLALVRADISRLPFASCSVDAIHAGAAIHCWPSPSNAVAEISRVLRPGGVFVGTTFLSSPRNNPFSVEALRPLRQIVGPVNTNYNYFTEGELEDLCKSCGLVNYSSKVQRSFIMFSGQKPY